MNSQHVLIKIVPWLMACAAAMSSVHAAELKVITKGQGHAPVSSTTEGNAKSLSAGLKAQANPSAVARYILVGQAPSVASYRGSIEGYASTKSLSTGKLNMRSSAAIAYQGYLKTTQAELISQIEATLGRGVNVTGQMQVAINAIVIELTASEAAKISALSGIESITRDRVSKLKGSQTITDASGASRSGSKRFHHSAQMMSASRSVLTADATDISELQGGFTWIKANDLWQGVSRAQGTFGDGAIGQGTGKSTMGEGMVVGVIDSGINPHSPSFAVTGGDGYTVKNPRSSYYGVCDPKSSVYDATFPCNDKLIGAWGYSGIDNGSPVDTNGHGSHTASTAAGNVVYGASLTTKMGSTITRDIAGVAPHANVIAYRACNENARCPESAMLAMIDQAIQDGVDVINFSVGVVHGSDPWVATDGKAFLSAMDAGIFVAVCAGNSGPGAGTIWTPANSPWVTAVADGSQQVIYKNALIDMQGGDTPPPEHIAGEWITDSYGPAEIIDAGQLGNTYCEKDKFTTKFDGAIVVCRYSTEVSTEDREAATFDNGAGAVVIVARKENSNQVPMGPGFLLAIEQEKRKVVITYRDGQRLLAWLDSGSGHTATLSGTRPEVDPGLADILAYDTSRGPNKVATSVVKPDITGPGKGIFAAFKEGYAIEYGTSMASPHIAGGAALLHSIHPDWTPMQIQSAMMTTSTPWVRKADGLRQATPFDMGAGRLDLERAARAGLLLDETRDNFLKADPYEGGDPAALNLASLGQQSCILSCSWQRTVTNGQDITTHWLYQYTPFISVSPAYFSLAPGESQTITFTVDMMNSPADAWRFDQITLKSLTYGVPDAHFPMAAFSASSNFNQLTGVDIVAKKEEGSTTISGLKARTVTDAQVTIYGPQKPTQFSDTISFADNNYGWYYYDYIVQVPEGAKRLVADITQTDAKNLEIYVGEGTEVDFEHYSYAANNYLRSDQYLNVPVPDSETIWIAVRGYRDGNPPTFSYQLDVAMLSASPEHLSVNVPEFVPAGQRFSAEVNYQLPGSEAGERYYGAFTMGTDSEHPDNLGAIGLNFIRK
ncbi:S8 family serine peptidase [Vibrio quintilis]|uniref:S8 family serine peptidase n=1 Tax=Vibrio quintilis TaxID=1117707 RepID=UPI0013565382|nr:S8 family serine peptidase [Vibrio quintilis]